VFTPNQEVKSLPQGATSIDFAFAIHTDLGMQCVGAKINGKLASLRQELKNGDIVEVLKSAQQTPNRDWLKFVKTSKARTKIASYIRNAEKTRALELGRELLEKELIKLGLDPDKFMKDEKLLPPAQAAGYMSAGSLFVALGLGKLKTSQFLAKLAPKEIAEAKRKKGSIAGTLKKLITRAPAVDKRLAVSIQGMDDLLIRFAQCCNPVPGDAIRGFISRGRGLVVHTVDCPNTLSIGLYSERSVDVQWDIKEEGKHRVMIKVETQDRPGILSKVTGVIAEEGSTITDASVKTIPGKRGSIYITLEVADLKQLQKLMNALMRIQGIISIERIKDKHAYAALRKPGKSS